MNLPEHILNAVKNGETSLGDNPAFPPGITGGKFLESLLKKRLMELSEDFKDKSTEELHNSLYEDLRKCKELERTCKPALEKLCGDVVNDLFKIPEDTVTIDMEISESRPSVNMNVEPEEMEDFSFDSIEDMGSLSNEIYKRRMTNALVEGASEYLAYQVSNYLSELFKIQPELPSLYNSIIKKSQYLTLIDNDSEIDDISNDEGYVIVRVGQIDEMPRIEARGAIFPILLQQTIKGLLEICVLGGLPKDKKKARFVMLKSDFKMAEKWDSRLGYPLWEQIVKSIEKNGKTIDEIGTNFILMELSNASVKAFNETLQEVFANTSRGNNIIGHMCDYIEKQKEQDEFDNYIEQQNSKYPIEDGYFTAEELIRDLPELRDIVGNN